MGKKVAPTLRERQAFAALMEEFIKLMPGPDMPQLTGGLNKFKSHLGRAEHREKLEQEQFERDFGHEDYRA